MTDVTIHHGDCIAGMRDHLADGSVRCTVTSIPFGALFSYSHKPEDVGNCRDGVAFTGTQFGLHMRFFFAELERVTSPGCLVCIHVQQLNTTQLQHGHMGLRDFRGSVIEMARRHGFQPHGEVAIPKNPQRVAQVRKLHSLLFVTGKRDSRALSPANNDFVLFFRKPGDDGRPVRGLLDRRENPGGQFTKEEWIRWARGTWEDIPDDDEVQSLDGYDEVIAALASEEWRTSGVWGDILETDVLDGWRGARGSDEEKHVCPLQLSVIRRCLLLYTNPGDLVLDPFMGIGSTAVVALELGRPVVGFELKDSYHRMAQRNVEAWRRRLAEEKAGQATLFEDPDPTRETPDGPACWPVCQPPDPEVTT